MLSQGYQPTRPGKKWAVKTKINFQTKERGVPIHAIHKLHIEYGNLRGLIAILGMMECEGSLSIRIRGTSSVTWGISTRNKQLEFKILRLKSEIGLSVDTITRNFGQGVDVKIVFEQSLTYTYV